MLRRASSVTVGLLAFLLATLTALPASGALPASHSRVAPFHGTRLATFAGGGSCGSTGFPSSPRFYLRTGFAQLAMNASTYPCNSSGSSFIMADETIGVESPPLNLTHSISNETATWNVSYNLSVKVQSHGNCSPFTAIQIELYSTFNLSGSFYFGHGYAGFVYLTTTKNISKSASTQKVQVFGNTRMTAGTSIRIFNAIEIEIRSDSGNIPGCSTLATVALASGTNTTHMVTWSIR